MEFWRIFRLVKAHRWMILSITLLVFFLTSVFALFRANRSESVSEAILAAQDAPAAAAAENAPAAAAAPVPDVNRRISELVLMMRDSNELVTQTVRLLRLPETDRAKEVRRILERNGLFASIDADIHNRVDEAVASGESSAGQRLVEIARLKKEARERQVNRLALARDSAGAFAANGVQGSPEELALEVRERVLIDPIENLLATEEKRDFANQIKVTGKFSREAEASLYVNMLCVAFIDFYRQQSSSASSARIAQLDAQRVVAEREVARVRQEEARFRARSDAALLTTPSESGAGNSLQSQEDLIRKYEQDLDGATAAVNILQGQLLSTSATRTVDLPVEESIQVKTLEAEVIRARAEFERVKATSNEGENYPFGSPVKAARDQLRVLEDALARARTQRNTSSSPNSNRIEIERALAVARERMSTSEAQLEVARGQLEEMRRRQRTLPAAQGALADIRDRLALKTGAYREILRNLDQEKLAAIRTNKAGTVTLVSQAVAQPKRGAFSEGAKLVGYATVLALLGAIGVVLLRDTVDNSIRTVEQAEELFGLPIAGTIPAQLPDPNRAPRITYLSPNSAEAEAYRMLRTDLLFSAEREPFQSVVAAAVKPGQGATTTLSNLAIALAQSGKRVILVDANLRRPRMHQIFGVPCEIGLTSVLTGQCSVDEALYPTGETANLLVLPAGPLTASPSELLGSEAMRALHVSLKEIADFVLFDAPAAIVFSDTTILASTVDRTLLVVKGGDVPRSAEKHVKALLEKARARILGVVLNAVTPEHVDLVYYHDHYYPGLKARHGEPPAALPPTPPQPPAGTLPADESDEAVHGAMFGTATNPTPTKTSLPSSFVAPFEDDEPIGATDPTSVLSDDPLAAFVAENHRVHAAAVPNEEDDDEDEEEALLEELNRPAGMFHRVRSYLKKDRPDAAA
jgi:capsular exopolysaccharide synthesis family protein